MKASVVIPVYNQYKSLKRVLHGFEKQNANKNFFEIILIDDGSNDELEKIGSRISELYPSLKINYIRQINMGRASARNKGIWNANFEIVIFCDADRYPAPDFVAQHIVQQQKRDIVIGSSIDFFGKVECFDNDDWDRIRKLSRCPPYLKKVSRIYDRDGNTDSNIAWISFLVGNSSVKKDIFCRIGGFDERFTDWGVEHFELALRMQKANNKFTFNPKAINYHIPHPRLANFYQDKLSQSLRILATIHPEVDINKLENIILHPLYPLTQNLFVGEKDGEKDNY